MKIGGIKLSFPYDWSNPDISDDALILNVLKRGIFEDICAICVFFGIEKVETMWRELEPSPIRDESLERMFDNIKKGFADAQQGMDC